MPLPSDVVPAVAILRENALESFHHAAGIFVDPKGQHRASIGNPRALVFSRSTAKPLQADAMISMGLRATPEETALIAGSHSGSEQHLEALRALLKKHDISENDLKNPAEAPLGARLGASAAVEAASSRLAANCSGKHAAMIATCLHNGWTVSDYLSPRSPLQKGIESHIAELTCHTAVQLGTDDCGTPGYRIALADLAEGYRRLHRTSSPALGALAQHPFLASGSKRIAGEFMTAIPDLIVKDGAEATFAGCTPDGGAFALKMSDGGGRGVRTLLAYALQWLGFCSDGSAALLAADEPGIDSVGHGVAIIPWRENWRV